MNLYVEENLLTLVKNNVTLALPKEGKDCMSRALSSVFFSG
jgi:hypothetical protein